MLSCYRVLDLTDDKAYMCGRALSDFGAEVIKIEKPGGDPDRDKGPFCGDVPDREKNLTWFAFNSNKKGITLDIEDPRGQEIFKKLAKTADVVLECYPPGYMDGLGLGYAALSEINPGLILTSITGFGQEGPYRDFVAPDIVVRALGGLIYTCGYEDRPPLTSSYRDMYSIGGMFGAVGTMMAICHRALTGKGQHVDAISQQAAVIICSAEIEGPYALTGMILGRHGRSRAAVDLKGGIVFYNPLLWECKDGDIAFNLLLNQTSARTNLSMMESMKREGIDIGFLENWEWDNKSWQDLTLEQAQEMIDLFATYFKKHTKAELMEMAIKHRFQLGPCNNAEDALNHPQLLARNFWKEIEHPELGTSFKYPGGAVTMTGGYCGPRHRAPFIGEHNSDIYGNDLGMSENEISALKESGVI